MRYPQRFGRVIRRALALALAILVAPLGASFADEVQDSKADLLYHIAKFIEWPATSFVKNQFTFAILGEDDLAAMLAGTMSTRSVNGRPVFVRCVRRPEDARNCQILFIAASEEKHIPEVLAALEGTSVLTVADAGGFAALGGMVDFMLENSRVRFEINRDRAERARLKISAKLLALAQIVEAESP